MKPCLPLRHSRLLFLAILLPLLMAGCGQRGPLRLPVRPPDLAPTPAATLALPATPAEPITPVLPPVPSATAPAPASK